MYRWQTTRWTARRRLAAICTPAAVLAVFAAAALSSAAGGAPACTISWTATGSGSWSTAANWTDDSTSAHRIPIAGDAVCITASGTYTVTGTSIANLASVTLGGTTGTQTLTIPGGTGLSFTGASTINTNGVLVLGSSTTSGDATLGSGSGTLTNGGTFETIQGAGVTALLRTNIVNDATATLGANGTDQDGGGGNVEFTNDGTLTISANDTYDVGAGNFDQAGGSVANNGAFTIAGSSDFIDRGGTTSGTAVTIQGTLDDDTSAGAASFLATGGPTILTGTGPTPGVGTGQTITLQAGDGLNPNVSMVNNGTVVLGNSAGTGGSTLGTGNAAAVFTNAGTLETAHGAGGIVTLRSAIVNASNGTVTLDASTTSADGGGGPVNFTNNGTVTIGSGDAYSVSTGTFANLSGGAVANSGTFTIAGGATFEERAGTTSGTAVTIQGTLDDDTSAGAASFLATGGPTILTGTGPTPGVGTGQTITLQAGDGLNPNVSMVNNGTVVLGNSAGTGGSTLGTGNAAAVFTNAGTLETAHGAGGIVTLRSAIVNASNGTVTLDASTTSADGGGGPVNFTNNGTVTIGSGDAYSVSTGTFANLSGGAVANSGTFTIAGGATFEERAGTTSGTAVTIQGTLDDDAGGGAASFLATGGPTTITGTGTNPGVAPGQTITVQASDSLNPATSIANDGTIILGNAANPGTSFLGNGAAGVVLTNNGTLDTVHGDGGAQVIRANVVNNATVDLAAAQTSADGGGGPVDFTNNGTVTLESGDTYSISNGSWSNDGGSVVNNGTMTIDGAATFVERAGTTSGNAITIQGTLDDDTTAGAGSFLADGAPTALTGTGSSPGIAANQTVTLNPGNGLNLTKSVTNDGTLVLGTPTGTSETVLSASSGGLLTNGGTIDAPKGADPAVLRTSITNNGTVDLADNSTSADGGGGNVTFTNNGTWAVESNDSFTINSGSTFTNASGGTVVFHIASATTYGTITTSGSHLAGTADPVPDGGYVPSATTEFEVVKDSTFSGCFTTVDSGFTADCTKAKFAGVGLIAGAPLTSTSIAIAPSSLNPSTFGQSVTFTATVAPTDGGGSVSFSSNSTGISGCNTQPLVDQSGSWRASCTTTTLLAGSDSVTAAYSGDLTYASSVTATPDSQTVDQAVPVITWSAPSAITYGTPLTGTQLDASASVGGTFAYAPPAGSVLGAGSHSLGVTFTPTDGVDYESVTTSVNLQVNQAVPVVSWGTPAPILAGTALSATQLDAMASVPGIFVYTPPSGTVLGVGAQPLSVTFTPTDGTDYTTVTTGVTIQVNAATYTLSWTTPGAITYGTALGSGQLDATATVPGAFVYTPPAGTVLGAGSHQLSVQFTPTDTSRYASSSTTVNLQVNQATPLITWATPAAITQGTPLSATQLDAMASVPGIFVYTPPSGTVLGVGAQPLSVTFTPTDGTDYTTVTTGVTIQVNAATYTLSWTTPGAITYGTALGSGQLDATATVPGAFVYTPPAGTVLGAGSHQLSVQFTPTDTSRYASSSTTVNLQVNQATPLITWATPAAITQGTPLSATQLDAMASVPGIFVYTPPSGTVLGAGAQPLSVTFTPTDGTDYTTVTDSVSLVVNAPATTGTTTTLSSSANPSTTGQALTFEVTVTPDSGSGTPTGTVIFAADGTPLGSATLSGGKGSITTTELSSTYADGSHTITAVYGGDSSFSGSSATALRQVVDPALYVRSQSPTGGPATISVVNAFTNQVAATLSIPNPTETTLEGYLIQPVLSPDGTRLYVPYVAGGTTGTTIEVINTATLQEVGSITAGGGEIALSPDGSRLYVSGVGLQVFNTATDALIGDAPFDYPGTSTPIPGLAPGAIVISPDGTKVYMIGLLNPTPGGALLVFNTATMQLTKEITGSGVGPGIAVSPDGLHVYVTDGFAVTPLTPKGVYVINTGTGTVTATYTAGAGGGPILVGPGPGGSSLYVGLNTKVVTLSATTGALQTTTAVPGSAIAMAFPLGACAGSCTFPVYVSNFGTSTVSLIQPGGTSNPEASISVAPYAALLAVAPEPPHPTPTTLTAGATLPAATVGVFYDAPLSASGGVGPDTWALTGGSLPSGLTLDPNTGMVYGIPTAAGMSTFTATASDSAFPPDTGTTPTLSIPVGPASTAPPSCGTLTNCHQVTSAGGSAHVSVATAFSTATVTATGSGSITVGQYTSNPDGAPPFESGASFFDVQLSSANTFTSLTIRNCGYVNTYWWWNPALDGGIGNWELVSPQTFVEGNPSCVVVTLSATSTPTLAQLSGTVFAIALPQQNLQLKLSGSVDYTLSGVVTSGTLTAPNGPHGSTDVTGTVILAGATQLSTATVTLDLHCLPVGFCLGHVDISDPGADVDVHAVVFGGIARNGTGASGRDVSIGPPKDQFALSWSFSDS